VFQIRSSWPRFSSFWRFVRLEKSIGCAFSVALFVSTPPRLHHIKVVQSTDYIHRACICVPVRVRWRPTTGGGGNGITSTLHSFVFVADFSELGLDSNFRIWTNLTYRHTELLAACPASARIRERQQFCNPDADDGETASTRLFARIPVQLGVFRLDSFQTRSIGTPARSSSTEKVSLKRCACAAGTPARTKSRFKDRCQSPTALLIFDLPVQKKCFSTAGIASRAEVTYDGSGQ
jgi:hypothetical protein